VLIMCADNDHGRSRIPTSQQGSTVAVADDLGAVGALVSVTIDGIEAKVPFGTTVLDAARTVGVRIPTLCTHPDLKVAGICRMCVVEIQGQRTLQAACAYPVTTPTLIVTTNSRRGRKARRNVLELLLSEHNGECYSCVRNGI
jgi:NADH dehydrogenase/NADH:ubiquinone oxidoreductase subunit G